MPTLSPALNLTQTVLKPRVRVNVAEIGAALRAITERAQSERGFTFFTANLHHLTCLRRDEAFAGAYARADFVSADGWPVVWLLRRAGRHLRRTTGADLLEPVCATAAELDLPIYVLGPGSKSQAGALARLQARHPTLRVAGAEAPERAETSDEAVRRFAQRINASGARLCFVSLGAPKQELLADALRELCPTVGFLCFGAAMDFISGTEKRAPKAFQAYGLEWFWRLALSPRKMARRYFDCVVTLAFLAPAAILRSSPESVSSPSPQIAG